MRRVALVLTVAALTAACAEHDQGAVAPEFTVPVFAEMHDAGGSLGGHNFRAHATGAQEVPARDTRAQGQATFQLSADGTELSFRLIVANIENVTQAHIHVAPAGANGQVVLWLYPDGPPATLIPGRSQGVLNEGTVTAADLVGPLAGASMDDLVALLRSGGAYINVHTSQYPPGEVRGQIR
jgi:hypothetical protein